MSSVHSAGVCPDFVGLGRRPFRLAVNGQAQQRRGAKAPLSALATRVSEGLPKGESASSALHNLSQAVYGLAHRAPTTLGHTLPPGRSKVAGQLLAVVLQSDQARRNWGTPFHPMVNHRADRAKPPRAEGPSGPRPGGLFLSRWGCRIRPTLPHWANGGRRGSGIP